jgi:transposase
MEQFLIAHLEHTPDIYLDELQEQLFSQHGIQVTLGGLSRTLRRLGYSSKKVCFLT